MLPKTVDFPDPNCEGLVAFALPKGEALFTLLLLKGVLMLLLTPKPKPPALLALLLLPRPGDVCAVPKPKPLFLLPKPALAGLVPLPNRFLCAPELLAPKGVDDAPVPNPKLLHIERSSLSQQW